MFLRKMCRRILILHSYRDVQDLGHRYYNLSSAYGQLGDFDQALVHLLRGIARQPDTVDSLN